MGTAYNAGKAFADALSQSISGAKQNVVNAIVPGGAPTVSLARSAAPSFNDFISGAVGGPAPLSDTATVHLPPARPVAVIAPAAAAKAPAKAPAAAAPDKAAADPLAGLGKLSFNQLLQLSEVSDHTAPKGVARPPSASDAAGGMLATIYNNNFQNDLKNAGKDPAKQQAAADAFEKKLLPLALKGNTADEYLYGGQGQ